MKNDIKSKIKTGLYFLYEKKLMKINQYPIIRFHRDDRGNTNGEWYEDPNRIIVNGETHELDAVINFIRRNGLFKKSKAGLIARVDDYWADATLLVSSNCVVRTVCNECRYEFYTKEQTAYAETWWDSHWYSVCPSPLLVNIQNEVIKKMENVFSSQIKDLLLEAGLYEEVKFEINKGFVWGATSKAYLSADKEGLPEFCPHKEKHKLEAEKLGFTCGALFINNGVIKRLSEYKNPTPVRFIVGGIHY